MCNRHSFLLTRAGKVLDGFGMTHSHTEIREMHGLHANDDKVNAYEWQPPSGWPNADWHLGLTKDTEVFEPKSSHLEAMERHVLAVYPTMEVWNTEDKPRVTERDLRAAPAILEENELIVVPETTLPSGLVVPSFKAFKYPASLGPGLVPVSRASLMPWVKINYHDTRTICGLFGLNLMRETQSLAIAWDISLQDINWTGGKVGVGNLFQGIRLGNVHKAQAGDFEPNDKTERTWHQLSNGERIYHFGGNIFSWVEDDTQGDERGLIAKPFAADSPSITIPYPGESRGQGWTPPAGTDWSGRALIRCGYWDSGGCAGVFNLGDDWPVNRGDDVGFRCTLPNGR